MCYVNSEVMSMWKKIGLAVLALLALAIAYVRPVYSVSLDGMELAGLWDGRTVDDAIALARAAAEEVARGDTVTPEPERSVRLSILPADGDKLELTRTLLAESDGVQRAWNVSVDGVGIGRTGDASALGEIVLAYIAEDAPSGCVSAGLTSSIELSEVYVPEGRVDDVMVISRRLRDMARVSYTMGDGSVVYG